MSALFSEAWIEMASSSAQSGNSVLQQKIQEYQQKLREETNSLRRYEIKELIKRFEKNLGKTIRADRYHPIESSSSAQNGNVARLQLRPTQKEMNRLRNKKITPEMEHLQKVNGMNNIRSYQKRKLEAENANKPKLNAKLELLRQANAARVAKIIEKTLASTAASTAASAAVAKASPSAATVASAALAPAPAALAPAPAASAQVSSASKPELDKAVKDSERLMNEIFQFLVKIQEKANGLKSNNTNKLSEVQSMIQKLENDIQSVSELIVKIGSYSPLHVNLYNRYILNVTAEKNLLQRKVNSIKNPAAAPVVAPVVASGSAAAPAPAPVAAAPAPVAAAPAPVAAASKSFVQSAPQALSGSPQPSGPKLVRLVRKRDADGTAIYTATIEQPSISGQLPTNISESWKTPGGKLIPTFVRNPLYKGSPNNLKSGGRKRTHKRAHRNRRTRKR
jgi:hypothetical protein